MQECGVHSMLEASSIKGVACPRLLSSISLATKFRRVCEDNRVIIPPISGERVFARKRDTGNMDYSYDNYAAAGGGYQNDGGYSGAGFMASPTRGGGPADAVSPSTNRVRSRWLQFVDIILQRVRARRAPCGL